MVLAELVAESPQRWRYLELVEALAARELPAAASELAHLVVCGLARPREPLETLEALVRHREFDAADFMYQQIRDQLGLDAGEDDPRIAGFTDRLSMARDAARLRVETNWRTLDDRARRAGLGPAPADQVVAAANKSARAVERLVAARKRDVEEAERRRREQLADELARSAPPGATDPALPPGVERALAAGDFDLAQEILRAGPDGALAGDAPLAVLRPPRMPSWPGSFDEVLARYARHSPASAEDNRHLPDRGDAPAAELVAAIIALREATDVRRAEALAASLALAVGGNALIADSALESTTEFTFRLGPPGDDPFIALFPAIRHGLPIRLLLEAEDVAGPLPPCGVTFYPGPPSEAAAEGQMLFATDVLPILARPPRNASAPSLRWINLLRAVLRRVPPEQLLRDGVTLAGPLGSRTALAWVLDLLDRAPDELLLDALLHEVGEHPLALRTALLALTARTSPGERVTLDDWRAVVPGLLPQLRKDVMESLRAGTVLLATLALVLESFRSVPTFTAADACASMSQVAGPRGQERLVDAANIGKALDGLTRLRILRRSEAGFRLPAVALTDALLTEPLNLDELAKNLERQAESLDQATAMVIGPLAVRALGHRLDNDVLRICRAMDRVLEREADGIDSARAELGRIRDEVAAMGSGSYARVYFDSLAPGQVADVGDVVRQATAEALQTVPPGMAVEPDVRSGDCRVEIVPALLGACLQDLIQNAATALSGFDPWPRAMIFVSVQSSSDLPTGVAVPPTVAPEAVMIEVRDNGPGFHADQLARLDAEMGVEEDVRRLLAGAAEHGRGLPLAKAVMRHFGGDLQIREQEAGATGAVVRLWLPRQPVRAAG